MTDWLFGEILVIVIIHCRADIRPSIDDSIHSVLLTILFIIVDWYSVWPVILIFVQYSVFIFICCYSDWRNSTGILLYSMKWWIDYYYIFNMIMKWYYSMKRKPVWRLLLLFSIRENDSFYSLIYSVENDIQCYWRYSEEMMMSVLLLFILLMKAVILNDIQWYITYWWQW